MSNSIPPTETEKATGFPSPAQGYEAKAIDLNGYLVRNPPATYFMKSVSSEMKDYGIFDKTLLIIDRSIQPKNGSIVIIAKDGEFLCREMRVKGRKVTFTDGHRTIDGTEVSEIFGTVSEGINDYAH
jgi:DNA polymerase V